MNPSFISCIRLLQQLFVLVLCLFTLLPMSQSFTITSSRVFLQACRSGLAHPSNQFVYSSSYSVGLLSRRWMSTSASANTASPPSSATQTSSKDEQFMRLAIRHAQNAYRDREVPIGAVIVSDDGAVLAAARNRVEDLQDASAHAELLALKRAAAVTKNWRLNNCTLYTTLEPCSMCLSAIQQFRIQRVVYSASDVRMGACGSWISLHEMNHPFHKVEVVGGVLAKQSGDLLRRFFQGLRLEKSRYGSYDLGRGCASADFVQLIDEAEQSNLTKSCDTNNVNS